MNSLLSLVNEIIFTPNKLFVSHLQVEKESQEYGACRFEIGNQKIICRNAKITPTKIGQFVAIWKRNTNGEACPFDETDDFDLLLINVQCGQKLGQFIFPEELLVAKGIISKGQKIGKRGIRVYPPWDTPSSQQAIKSQIWQNQFFLNAESSKHDVARLYTKISS